jgi:hypothetical protein
MPAPPHLVVLVAGIPLLLSLLHPRHHCQPLCILAAYPGFHQVCEMSNWSVQLRQFLCLLLYHPFDAAPPVAGCRQGFALPPPFSVLILYIGSNMVASAVSAAVGVVAIAISIAKSIGTSLLPIPDSPGSRSLLRLTLNSVITSVSQASKCSLLLARWLTCRIRRVVCQAFTRTHSFVWIPVRALFLWPHWFRDTRSGVDLTSRIDCRRPFFLCYHCCRLTALFLFRQDSGCLLMLSHVYT